MASSDVPIARVVAVTLLVLSLAACAGPTLEAFNDRGGVVDYHMVNSSMSDVLAVAERYCAGIGRKARLGTPTMGLTSMQVSFECVE